MEPDRIYKNFLLDFSWIFLQPFPTFSYHHLIRERTGSRVFGPRSQIDRPVRQPFVAPERIRNTTNMQSDLWYLEEFDLYKILCPNKMAAHLEQHPLQVLRRDEFLFRSKEPCEELILIHRGIVKLVNYDPEGQEIVLTHLGRGDLLGQMALVGETSHRTYAIAMQNDTQVCKMKLEKVRALRRAYIPFGVELNRRIGLHLRKLERRVEILANKSIRTRLVEFILDMGQCYGVPKDGGIRVNHGLTQQDIATLIGTSRKSASLLLNTLEDEGHIRFDRRHIFIVNAENFAQARLPVRV